MSANNNNKRVRRAIVEILLEHGGCTREQVAYHLQNYKVIKTEEDLILTRPISVMTPSERRKAKQCRACARTRILPDDSDECITCIRRG